MIDQEYVKTGKVRVVFKNRAALAQESGWAAEAALCAADENKFWDYHDALYEALYSGDRTVFTKDGLKALAAKLGLKTEPFNACVDAGKYRQRVQDEGQESQTRGVSGTPTFYINDTQIVGAQPYEVFKKAIDAELAK